MTSCLICGCVKNCEKYLDDVFNNISKIQELFTKSKIIISFDMSNDYTLKKLVELKHKFDIDIIINKDPLTNIRTVNIERARNKILNKIYNEYSEYDYFIMIDMDDVSSKPININILKEILNEKKVNIWDGLFFNNANYYDFWALNFKDFQYSCWHSANVIKLINLMNQEFKTEIINKEFLECESAFGGFGIYKIKKFYPETNHISVSFCNLKDRQSIDSYKSRPVCLDDLDMFDIESFSESLVKKSGLRKVAEQEEKLDVIEDNKPDDIQGNFEIRDLIGKVICVKYFDRKINKLHMRRVKL